MKLELKPCPFCGSDAEISSYETESLWSSEQVTYTKVSCSECDIAFQSEPGHTTQSIAAWNRRAISTVTPAEVGGLVERLLIDRFDLDEGCFLGERGRMEPDATGEWVRYSDAICAIEAQKSIIAVKDADAIAARKAASNNFASLASERAAHAETKARLDEVLDEAVDIIRQHVPYIPPDGPTCDEQQAAYEAVGFALQALSQHVRSAREGGKS